MRKKAIINNCWSAQVSQSRSEQRQCNNQSCARRHFLFFCDCSVQFNFVLITSQNPKSEAIVFTREKKKAATSLGNVQIGGFDPTHTHPSQLYGKMAALLSTLPEKQALKSSVIILICLEVINWMSQGSCMCFLRSEPGDWLISSPSATSGNMAMQYF